MTGQVTCRACGKKLPWFITLKVSGVLCLPCLEAWHRQRQRESA